MSSPTDTSLKFGTSGLRGLAVDLLDGGAAQYVAAFCDVLLERGTVRAGDGIYLAHDHRESSPVLLQSAADAIAARGLTPVSCGATPTPALALHAMGADAPAIMITGSHIPADRNGLKFYRPDGEIDKADEVAIQAAALAVGAASVGVQCDFGDESALALAGFEARCLRLASANGLLGMKVGLYAHTSVAVDFITHVLESLGSQVVVLGASKHFVPMDTESIPSETEERFRAWASELKLDAIVSTDADADRPLVVDETGMPMRGDLLGLLAAAHVGARSIVTPVTSNSGIRDCVDWQVVRTKVGSPYVLSAMADAALPAPIVGFEANGGTLLQNRIDAVGGPVAALPTRDSMLPILATLLRAKADGIPLSQLQAAYPMPVAHADRLQNYPTETAAAFVAHLSLSLTACDELLHGLGTARELDTTDGARITLDDGRIVHFRPSGNAPELRCYSEAPDQETAHALVRDGLAVAGDYLKRA
ncbi:MAG: phosphomannomutase [Pseudomonadota bacterium]